MKLEQDRQNFIKAWQNIIGYPYIWAGEDPILGFDCSGAVRYCWIMAGYHMEKDRNAWSMCWDFWKDCRIPHDKAREGDLRFYGQSQQGINHVMCVFREWPNNALVLCGARGGNADTKNTDIAYKNWALVDICKDSTYWRKNLQFTVNPFLKLDKVIACSDEIAQEQAAFNAKIKPEKYNFELPQPPERPKRNKFLQKFFPFAFKRR